MRTILIVDDDGAVRRVMARFLRIKGFVVIEAANGQEALALLQAGLRRCGYPSRPPDAGHGWLGVSHCPARRSVDCGYSRDHTSGADAHRFHELKAAATFQEPVTISRVVKVLEDLLAIP